MACSIEKQNQIKEAAKIEYKRLAALRDLGYDSDLDNGIYDINEALDNMRAIVYSKVENVNVKDVESTGDLLSSMLKANGDDGTLAMSFNGSTKYEGVVPEKIEMYEGKYILTTDKGVYRFASGAIQSDVVNGKYVVVPAMVLAKPKKKDVLDTLRDLQDGKYAGMKINYKDVSVVSNTGLDADETIKKYQNKLIAWVKDKTQVKVKNNNELLELSKTLLKGIDPIIAKYTPSINTIEMVENLELAVYKDLRGQMINGFKERNSITKPLDKATENAIIEILKKDGMDLDSNVKQIVSLFEGINKDQTLAHEMVHAGVLGFMANQANKDTKAMKRMEELFQMAIDSKSVIDKGMVDGSIINQYWSTNIHEFVAEGLSNPQLMNVLMQIPVKDKSKLSSLFTEFVSTLLEMLGVKGEAKDSLYEYLLDGFMYTVEQEVGTKYDSAITDSIMGSDENGRIGNVESDKKLGSEELDLGEVLKEEFNAYYSADVEEGRPIESQEFADFQGKVLDTYESTMKDLGTGNIKVEMFTSEIDATSGSFDLRTNEMKVRWNNMSRLSRVSEVFLHEINHKMSSHVFAKNIGLTRLMEDLRNSAIDSGVTYKLFLEGVENPTNEEIELAKKKFEYTFDKTANIEEFYAYATTNEQVYNAVKDVEITSKLVREVELDPSKKQPMTKVLNALIGVVNTVWKAMSGRGKAGGAMLVDMINTIAKLDTEMEQTKANSEMEMEGISGFAKAKIAQLDEVAEPVVTKVGEWVEKLQSIKSSGLAAHIAKIPVLNDLMETGVSQYLWRAVTQDTTTEEVADMYMVFRHSKQVVEKHTTDIRNGVKSVATDIYKEVPKEQKDAVTKIVLAADLAQFNAETIKTYLDDEKALKDMISDLSGQVVKGTVPGQKLLEKIDSLANYMVTGKSTGNKQQINATNLAKEAFSEISKSKVTLIDKIASLRALEMSSEGDKIRLRELLDSENGVEVVNKTINMYRGYIDNMREDATIDQNDPIPKGYIRPKDGLLRYELVPAEEVEAQESIRMNLVDTKPYVVVEGKEYYLMTGMTKSVGFSEGAIGLISHTTEGIPMSSLIRKNNELSGKLGLLDGELKKKTNELIKGITAKGKPKITMGDGNSIVPVYNHKHEIVDYRIQLNSLEKSEYLPDREMELEDVMSNTFSRSIKTTLTATENKKVVDTIIEHSAKGVLENPDDYVLVEEYTEQDALDGVKREKRHDRWEYLPDHTKEYIYKQTRNKGLLIHKDFVELMTGEKDITIGNFAKFGVDLKKHPIARARLMALEAYVSEILGYVKQAMVVLNGDILVGNQVSNAMVASVHGIDPIRYSKKFKARWQQLNDYNEKVQMLSELEVRKMAGENVDSKMRQLNKQLEGNIWNELVKDGQYTALVEDINVDSKMDGQLMAMLQDKIDKSKYGEIIDTMRNVGYINKTSALYGVMLKTVHYGDAITRQIIKEELEAKAIEREGSLTDESKREILNYLDQLLVNYGYTMNRWWKYAERVGGLFFMRYYMGQAKALASMAKKNPTRSILMQGAQKVTGLDVADPVDTYMNSGIDGIGYRWMLDDAPSLIAEPNILDLIPSLSSALTVR